MQNQSNAENSVNDADNVPTLPAVPANPLPSLAEADERVEAGADSASSPSTSRKSFSFLSAITQRTPKAKTPIKPTSDEMHPHHHQKSTSTPYDEARWLGFFNMAPNTAPAKSTSFSNVGAPSPTPTMEPDTAAAGVSTPEFKFGYKRQSLELSPEAQKMMLETREEAAKIRARMSILPPVPTEEPGAEPATTGRKIAKPKGKVNRFSDAHMAEFKKMDSIANHPSAWRATQAPIIETKKTLKRSPSKAELDKSESNPFLSKARSVATIALSALDSDSTPSKRIKVHRYDDASSKKIVHPPSTTNVFATPKTAPADRRKSGLSRPLSSLMSPTKASLARSQSVKNLKAQATFPTLTRSNSTKSLRSPFTPRTKIDTAAPKPASPTPIKVYTAKDAPVKAPAEFLKSPPATESDSTPKIKSILRTPQLRYSDDPAKIAAGTHLATPPNQRNEGRPVPRTAPVYKHVDFTASALAKAQRDEVKAASVEPNSVCYPSLPIDTGDGSDNRRSTISSLPIPGSFTFRSGTPVTFGPLPDGPTIRTVPPESCVGTGLPSIAEDSVVTSTAGSSPSKRKLTQLFTTNPFADAKGGVSEKENQADDEREERPAKRMRKMSSPPPEKRSPNKLQKKSRFLIAKGKMGSGLTASRLNMLATPKRR